jgi:flagellin-specific chaperone FliS
MDKRSFSNRIKRANTIQLVSLTLEMAIGFIDDGLNSFAQSFPMQSATILSASHQMPEMKSQKSMECGKGFDLSIAKAQKAIQCLAEALNFEYPQAHNLMDIYLGINRHLCLAISRRDKSHAVLAKDILSELHSFWVKQENSPMPNAQPKVFLGLTYHNGMLCEHAESVCANEFKA